MCLQVAEAEGVAFVEEFQIQLSLGCGGEGLGGLLMCFEQRAQLGQVLHGEQLAVGDGQGASLAQDFKSVGWQVVQGDFIDAVETFYLVLSGAYLQGDGPGLDELVFGQGVADTLGQGAVLLQLGEKVQQFLNGWGGVALRIKEGFAAGFVDQAAVIVENQDLLPFDIAGKGKGVAPVSSGNVAAQPAPVGGHKKVLAGLQA